MPTTKGKSTASQAKEINPSRTLLLEVAWEVCNQVGGIYTVIRSKIPAVKSIFQDNYCLIGPALHPDRHAELDPIEDGTDLIARSVERMRQAGHDVFYGTWLVTGRPKVVLFGIEKELDERRENSKQLFLEHGIPENPDDDLLSQVIALGKLISIFIELVAEENKREKRTLISHFHEWMAALPILDIRKKKIPVKTVFTTHATILGRYLAMNDPMFYENLKTYDWKEKAQHFGIQPLVAIERACAKEADTFTTVSEVTGRECVALLGKKPDHIVPNGLNIKRFVAYHEVQILHQDFKDEINKFVVGHFFSSYSFDLDKTLYFYTSGRYEYHNKGYDTTLKALNRLNELMKEANSKMTVVMFLVTKRPTWSINPVVLQSHALMEELRHNTEAIQSQVGERLFLKAASSDKSYILPDLNEMVDDYWRLRYRRTIQAWKTDKWPIIVTHNLHDQHNDEVLVYLRENKLINSPEDKVKIVYHPDFISSTNPLFGIDYGEFVRGCHLGVFPSYYEPWGYTPLESIASGVPTITSDLSGFGDYVKRNMNTSFDQGVSVLNRDGRKEKAIIEDLAQMMFSFVKESRRYRITQRNKAEDLAESFDWHNLIEHYMKAYTIAINKKAPRPKPVKK
ncbi:MAG: glycosyltransferase [Cyclobacteriaceae bacterium]|nr:glycosyltransferase [Cyclobacteriaceae bacterium]